MNRREFFKKALIGAVSAFVIGPDDVMDEVEARRGALIPPSQNGQFLANLWSEDILSFYQRSSLMSKKLGMRF